MAAAPALAAAYALWEPHRYRFQTHRLPVRPGLPPLRVLHLSDTHMSEHDRQLCKWLKELPAAIGETPDLLVATGDFIEGDAGIPLFLEAARSFQARLGLFFVLGSHDYYLSTGPTYTKYWTGDKSSRKARRADTRRLEEGLAELGWTSLTNRSVGVEDGDRTIRLSGVDDPYLSRHSTAHIGREADDTYAIGLMHAPDLVSEFALAGFDLVVGGHTHSGQVRIPPFGALVTNCSLPAGLAGGPHLVGSTWLHVSPGLGTGRFTPIRFACRPEATLLELQPSGGQRGGM